MRRVVVQCDGDCGVEMTLDQKPEEGGFMASDIEQELRDCSWVRKDGKDYCDECAVQPEGK